MSNYYLVLTFVICAMHGLKANSPTHATVTCVVAQDSLQPVKITIEVPANNQEQEGVLEKDALCVLGDPACDPDFDAHALLSDENTKHGAVLPPIEPSVQVKSLEETAQHILLRIATKEHQKFSGCSLIEDEQGQFSIVVAKDRSS